MTKLHATRGDEHEQHRAGLTTVLGRLLLSLAAILAILYGSLLAISRTDGFREMMREQLGERWGLPKLDFEQIRLDARLNLIILDLSYSEPEAGALPCGLRIESMLLRFRPRLRPAPRLALESVVIEGAEVDFLLSSEGLLHPQSLAAASVLIGDVLTARDSEPDKADVRRTSRPKAEACLEKILAEGTKWRIGSSSLVWRNQKTGRILQRAERLSAVVSPIEIDSGPATYIHMATRSRSGLRDPISDMQIEMIRLANGQTRVIDMH